MHYAPMMLVFNIIALVQLFLSAPSYAQDTFPPLLYKSAFIGVRAPRVTRAEQVLRPKRYANRGVSIRGWNHMLRNTMQAKLKRIPTAEEWIQQSEHLDAIIFAHLIRYDLVGEDWEQVQIRKSDLYRVKIRGFKAVPQALLMPALPKELQDHILCVDPESLCFVPILRYEESGISWKEKRLIFTMPSFKKRSDAKTTVCPNFKQPKSSAHSLVMYWPYKKVSRTTFLNVLMKDAHTIRVISNQVIVY